MESNKVVGRWLLQAELDSSVADSFTAMVHTKFIPDSSQLKFSHNLHIRYHPSSSTRYAEIEQPIIEAYYEPTEAEWTSAKNCQVSTLREFDEGLKVIAITRNNFSKALITIPSGVKNTIVVIITVFVTCFGTFYTSTLILKI